MNVEAQIYPIQGEGGGGYKEAIARLIKIRFACADFN